MLWRFLTKPGYGTGDFWEYANHVAESLCVQSALAPNRSPLLVKCTKHVKNISHPRACLLLASVQDFTHFQELVALLLTD